MEVGGSGVRTTLVTHTTFVTSGIFNMILFPNRSYVGITVIERRFQMLISEAHSNMKALILAVISK